jgi:hypothetical protein
MLTSSAMVAPPANGTAFVSGPSFGYTPKPGFAGTDTFQMSLSGQAGGLSGTSLVTVQVRVSQ